MTGHVIDIDITVPRGDKAVSAHFQSQGGITVLFGASGAGKTTVLEAIAGMTRPIAGHITVNGRTLFDSTRRIDLPLRARRIGYVAQDLLLFPHLSVAAQLRFGARRGGPDIAEVAAACEIDGLLQRRPDALSGGEQRRVALARALMTAPDLLALDEPLAGLDPPRRQRLLAIIERLRSAGGPPILYVGHFAEEAVRLADTAVMMAQGHVIAAGTAETVFADHRAQAHFGLFDQGTVLAGTVAPSDQPGLSCVVVAGGALLIAGPPPGALGEPVRLRILARDVAIARTAPQDTSILNIVPASVTALNESAGDVMVDMRLGNGQGSALAARITAISAQRLALNRGDRVYALVKAVAVSRRH